VRYKGGEVAYICAEIPREPPSFQGRIQSILGFLFLAYFPYFVKIKRALLNHQPVCVSLLTPESRKNGARSDGRYNAI
jgi:hypothetical protein